MEGNLRLKIDWASLIVGSKFTVFALFYLVFEGNFPSTSPEGGAYIWGSQRVFCATGLGGAYIWRGLFSEFCGKPFHDKLLNINLQLELFFQKWKRQNCLILLETMPMFRLASTIWSNFDFVWRYTQLKNFYY